MICQVDHGRIISTRIGNAGGWLPMLARSPVGTWRLAAPEAEKMRELLDGEAILAHVRPAAFVADVLTLGAVVDARSSTRPGPRGDRRGRRREEQAQEEPAPEPAAQDEVAEDEISGAEPYEADDEDGGRPGNATMPLRTRRPPLSAGVVVCPRGARGYPGNR